MKNIAKMLTLVGLLGIGTGCIKIDIDKKRVKEVLTRKTKYSDKKLEHYHTLKRETYGPLDFDISDQAEQVYRAILEKIDTDGFVTIADVDELIGIESTYTDRLYGWKSKFEIDPDFFENLGLIYFAAPSRLFAARKR